MEEPEFRVDIDEIEESWGIYYGTDGDWGTITGGNVVRTGGQGNKYSFFKPILETCWQNDGKGTVPGKLNINDGDIIMDATFCIKRP
jgi:hypothetical protein